jgi:hypothetical protein
MYRSDATPWPERHGASQLNHVWYHSNPCVVTRAVQHLFGERWRSLGFMKRLRVRIAQQNGVSLGVVGYRKPLVGLLFLFHEDRGVQ